MKRGTVKKSNSKLLTFWIPSALEPALIEGVAKLDLDKSKFIRAAIREKLVRAGVVSGE